MKIAVHSVLTIVLYYLGVKYCFLTQQPSYCYQTNTAAASGQEGARGPLYICTLHHGLACRAPPLFLLLRAQTSTKHASGRARKPQRRIVVFCQFMFKNVPGPLELSQTTGAQGNRSSQSPPAARGWAHGGQGRAWPWPSPSSPCRLPCCLLS